MGELNWGLLQQGQGGNALIAGVEAGTQAKRQDRKDALEERAITGQQDVGNALAKGDYDAASTAAIKSGNTDLLAAVNSASKAHREKLSDMAQAIGTVAFGLKKLPPEQRPAALAAAAPTLKQHGVTDDVLAGANLTDEGLDGYVSSALTLKDAVAQANTDRTFDHTVKKDARDFDYKVSNDTITHDMTRRGQDVTVRGQNMVDARARETSGGAKVPAGYRAKDDGTLEYIPGGPADPTKGAGKKAPTEDQAKNTQLYQRAAQQLPILLDNFDALSSIGNQVGSKVPGTSLFTSEKYQRATGALKDIAASYLYSVSGATANPGEVKNLTDTVTPIAGDSAQTIADKKARVAQMVESIKARAQPTAQPAQTAQAPAPAPKGPKVGYVQSGYRFKGGDPADKSNWEKTR